MQHHSEMSVLPSLYLINILLSEQWPGEECNYSACHGLISDFLGAQGLPDKPYLFWGHNTA